jgi:hypothetical protein
MNLLDPQRIAAFFAMPGATELVEAFSTIPPGPVRDSIVAHAQALATMSGWPTSHAAGVQYGRPPPPEPLIAWQGAKPLAPPQANGEVVWRNGRPGKMIAQPAYAQTRADGKIIQMPASERFYPFREGGRQDLKPPPDLKSASEDGRIVERVLRGETPKRVADDCRIDVHRVYALMERARREGVVFPRDKKATPQQKSTAVQWVRRVISPGPGPWWWQDPTNEIWEKGHLLPTGVIAERSIALVGPMTSVNFRTMTSSAARRGWTLRQYVAKRLEAYERVKGGEPPVQTAAALKVPEHWVYSVLTQVGYTASDAAHEHAPLTSRADPVG